MDQNGKIRRIEYKMLRNLNNFQMYFTTFVCKTNKK